MQTTEPRTRYPPLVVEHLPNWAHHFRQLAEKLGRRPNARPYGLGQRFIPADDQEYRAIQSYLNGLNEEEGVSCYSYSLLSERSLKVAICGLPVDPNYEVNLKALQAERFEPENARSVKGR